MRRAAAVTALALVALLGSGSAVMVAPPRARYVLAAPAMGSRERARRR